MRSYALRPSSDASTVSGCSASAARTWPARPAPAEWLGQRSRHSFARVRDTRRRNVSPVAMPRTPPSAFRKAVSRVRAKPSATSAGTCARARWVAASARRSTALRSCSNSFRCSARMPGRPAAPPLRASRSAAATASAGRRTGCASSCCRAAAGMAARGSGGRRSGSVRAR